MVVKLLDKMHALASTGWFAYRLYAFVAVLADTLGFNVGRHQFETRVP